MKTKILVLALITSFVQAETTTPTSSLPKSSISVSSLVTTSTNTSWVDQKIEEIKPQRNGLSSSTLASLRSPFIVIIPKSKDDGKTKPNVNKAKTDTKNLLPTKKDMSKEPLTLQIVLNSSALINGKWLKENDTFRGYKLSQIQSNHVVMERKNKKIKLFIARKSKNINISTK
ncbi:MAG: hypothetical protein COA44_04460 [Arcobacter sp.]|nr:MAG: hypothetical protein COA44_04460 [Arcobacter sp.]